jgi:ectoine hydroxylase-related dioxygenase (phytanoyl-CoA dioxygenase family)
MPSVLTQAQVAQFHEDGLVFARGLFDAEEVALLRRAMEEDPQVRDHILDRLDANGAATRISLWNRAGDSVYGLAARSARVVDTAAALLGGPVYHFQSKLTAKDPFVGGAWEWHQDYGYWYHNGCLFPNLLSFMVALDRTTRDNGCLQLVKGSNRVGRIDHVPIEGSKDQVAADPQRMAHLTQSLEIVYAELEPGDAVIFHCNTLHQSAQNRSPDRRWTFLACYNRVDNDTVIRDHGRYYVPLATVPDGAIKAAGLKFASGGEDFTSRPFVPKVREQA